MRAVQAAAPSEASDASVTRPAVVLLPDATSGSLGPADRSSPAARARADGARAAPESRPGRGPRARRGLLGTRAAERAVVLPPDAGGGLGAHQPDPQALPGTLQRARYADRSLRA